MEKFSPVIFYTLPYKICQMYNCIYVMCAKNSALSYQIDVPPRIRDHPPSINYVGKILPIFNPHPPPVGRRQT